MNSIHTIHFVLTPFQIRLLDKIRTEMPHLSEADLQRHVASMGILTIAERLCELAPPEGRAAPIGEEPAPADDTLSPSITIDLYEHHEALSLIRERHPKGNDQELVQEAVARGILSMLAEERDKDRERDGIPLDDEWLARFAEGSR